MPLTSHLEELRTRLIIGLITYVVAALVCYAFATQLFEIIKRPLTVALADYPDGTLAIRTLTEGFLVELKVAAIAGLFLASPMFFFQIWKFVSPGLYKHEQRLALPVILSASALFLTGASFGYFVVFPFVFKFFLSYTGGDTQALLSVGDYLGFSAKFLTGFGVVFELPLIIFLLAWLGIVDHHTLRRVRRYVIVANFAVAALITPPDIISQIFIAIPLILLYEIGIVIARIVGRKRRTDEDVGGQASSS